MNPDRKVGIFLLYGLGPRLILTFFLFEQPTPNFICTFVSNMRIYYVILIVLVLCASGCKKKLTQFYLNYNSEVVIPSTFGQIVPISINTPAINSNSTQEFEVNNTKKKYIESIFLKEMNLIIISPTNETFSFLNSLEVFISSDNFPEKKVAFKYSIPATVGDTIICDLSDTDLQEYIKEETFDLRIATESDETIPEDVSVEIQTKFLVDAKLRK